jgi:hypothetical protein
LASSRGVHFAWQGAPFARGGAGVLHPVQRSPVCWGRPHVQPHFAGSGPRVLALMRRALFALLGAAFARAGAGVLLCIQTSFWTRLCPRFARPGAGVLHPMWPTLFEECSLGLVLGGFSETVDFPDFWFLPAFPGLHRPTWCRRFGLLAGCPFLGVGRRPSLDLVQAFPPPPGETRGGSRPVFQKNTRPRAYTDLICENSDFEPFLASERVPPFSGIPFSTWRRCFGLSLIFGEAKDTHTHSHTDTHRHTDTQTHTDTHRHTQTHTDTHRHTQTHTDTVGTEFIRLNLSD